MLRTTALSICILASIAQLALAQEIRIVAIPGTETTDGSRSAPNDANTVLRTQELWAASLFGALPPGGAWLVGLQDRLDGSATSGAVLTQNVSISVSTSSQETIGFNYEQNIGNDVVEVLAGDISRQYLVAEVGTNPFGDSYIFDTPFFYDPSRGDLLLDFRINGGTGDNIVLDSHDLGRPAGNFGNLNGVTADGRFSDQVVTQFLFNVPEPSTFTLGTFASLGLLLGRNRRALR